MCRWCGSLVRSGIEGGIDYKDHSLGRLEASDARYSELSSIIDLHASVSLLFTDIPNYNQHMTPIWCCGYYWSINWSVPAVLCV
eukprot:scaffold21939_cov77-Skeletonema_marinoi.AAC.1